ncbi:hypothetical protein M3Y99_01157500 [Aphelenchoides fujianensis]|nr:hypothetical protein M3Y99_01157500 [Aphelenchoides fujianensis]
MKLPLIIGFAALAALVFVAHGQNSPNPDAQRVDLAAVFKALLIDMCNQKCSDDLKSAIQKTLGLVNVYDNIQGICTAYNSFTLCEKQRFCPKLQPITALATTSWVEKLCSPDIQQQLKDKESCIKPQLDSISQNCDKQCSFVKNLADYTQDPTVQQGFNTLGMIGQLGGVCSGFQCYFTCVQKDLNQQCQGAATPITESLFAPFYQLSDFVTKLSPAIQNMAKEKLPQECVALTNKTKLDEITHSGQARF